MNRGLEYRPMQKNGFCRGCDKVLNKGDFVIATYSFRNRGQHIYICEYCVLKMYELIGYDKPNIQKVKTNDL